MATKKTTKKAPAKKAPTKKAATKAPRNSPRIGNSNAVTERRRESPAAGNLRRQHTMRNDTAGLMKSVQRESDGAYVAPTVKRGPLSVQASPSGAAAAFAKHHPNRPHKTDHSPGELKGTVKPMKAPTKGHHTPPALKSVSSSHATSHNMMQARGQLGASHQGAKPAGTVQTGKNGGKFILLPSGKKKYLGKKSR